MDGHGTLAERFELLDELGRGAMGVVLRARERSTGREVALKVLHEGSADPELAARARREAELQARLDHPGIVTVHAAGEEAGRPWIASELVVGARRLDVAWRDLDRAARVATVRDVARALGHAHARGVVHRDVKSENILVDPTGRPRLTDFGIALHRSADRLTRTGELLGTPHAMAPEQVLSDRAEIGPPTDVWAAGVLLYEALTGERPFTGTSLPAVAEQILKAAPRPPRALDPTISLELERVALHALSLEPGRRPPDGEALARAIEAAMRAPAATDERRRSTLLLGVAVAALLLAVAALLLAPSPTPTPTTPVPPPTRTTPVPTLTPTPLPTPTSATPAPTPVAPERALAPIPSPDEDELVRLEGAALTPERMGHLGKLRHEGRWLEPDARRALAWLHAAADRLDPGATRLLWKAPLGLAAQERRRWLLTAAERGDPDAMGTLSQELKLEGDDVEALRWARRFFDEAPGKPWSPLALAQCLDDTPGRRTASVADLRSAVELYGLAQQRCEERAARRRQKEQESPGRTPANEQEKDTTPVTVAGCLTRLVLARPDAVDDFEALRAIVARAAAMTGDEGGYLRKVDRRRAWVAAWRAANAAGAPPEAWLRLGEEHLALTPLEPPASHVHAAAVAFRVAADQGHVGAQLALAKLQHGRGAEAEAAVWLDRAAARGSLEASALLAELLVDGRPHPPDDLARAAALADVAAASSDDAVAARGRAAKAAVERRRRPGPR